MRAMNDDQLLFGYSKAATSTVFKSDAIFPESLIKNSFLAVTILNL